MTAQESRPYGRAYCLPALRACDPGNRSLVAVSADEPPRYQLLDSPREYARERLAAAGEFDVIAGRHARAIRALYESACDSLIRSRTGVGAAFAAMAPDLDNAQAALTWAQTRDEQTAASLMIGIGSYLGLTGAGFMGVPPHLIQANVPYEHLPYGQVSIWSWAVSRARSAAAVPTGRDWADRAIAHARAHGDMPRPGRRGRLDTFGRRLPQHHSATRHRVDSTAR